MQTIAAAASGVRIGRRHFVSTALASMALSPIGSVWGQAPERIRRIGFLTLGTELYGPPHHLLKALRDLGWIEGVNFQFERRFAEQPKDLAQKAAELVSARVDVIITNGTPAARAAKEATSTIPIIIQVGANPVANGLVQSLSRPGGNVTGFFNGNFEDKTLQLVKEVRPSAKSVVYPEGPASVAVTEAASRLGLKVVGMPMQGTSRDVSEFAAFLREKKPDVAVVPGYSWIRDVALGRIIQLLYDLRMPSVGEWVGFAEGGGLMSFGAQGELTRTAAKIDRLLRGDSPADMPIELPRHFHLAVNRGTAKAIGVTIPRSVESRVDQFFE